MNDNAKPPMSEEDEARAMLEKYKDQIQKECQMSPEATAELDKLVEGQSLIFGAKDELSFRRMLRDIRESGEDDE